MTHMTLQFHTDPLSSTHRFNTMTERFQRQNPSVPNQKPLSSTTSSVQHPKFLNLTPKTPQFHTLSARRGFRCWTEGFLVLNWGIFGAKKVWSLCGTDVLNWGGLCGTEGYSTKCYRKFFKLFLALSLIEAEFMAVFTTFFSETLFDSLGFGTLLGRSD